MRFNLKRLFSVVTLVSLYMAAVSLVMSLFRDSELSFRFRLVYALIAVFIVFGLPGVMAGAVIGKLLNRTGDGVIMGAIVGLIALSIYLGLPSVF